MVFSKNYKVIPLHLERPIPFLERSQGSGREPPAWFLLTCRAVLGGQDSPPVNSSPAGSLRSLDKSDSLSWVFLPENNASSFSSLLEGCWEGRRDAAAAQPPLRGFVLCILSFSQRFMHLPCFFPAARVVVLAPACTQPWQCLAGVCKWIPYGLPWEMSRDRWQTHRQLLSRSWWMILLPAVGFLQGAMAMPHPQPHHCPWCLWPIKKPHRSVTGCQVVRTVLPYESLALPNLSGVKSKLTQVREDSHWF